MTDAVGSVRILAFADYYLPGFKAGGPIRALANLVDAFDGEIEFDIITRGYDLGGDPYEGIVRDSWQQVGPARVRYVGSGGLDRGELKDMLRDPGYDAVYLNSIFSPLSRAVMRERLLGAGNVRPLIVAPRGEFSPAALRLKRLRKMAYLSVMKRLGGLRGIFWQASSEHEAENIKSVLGDSVTPSSIFVTEEVPGRLGDIADRAPKLVGAATLSFLSRICRMKNLDTAIEVLRGVRGRVTFAVYGPLEDLKYWEECQRAAASLPDNIEFDYRGVVPYESVSDILAQSDLFFLPTRGENYGHVIVEALAAGAPVLVSDRTRWRNLESRGVGWDADLDNLTQFRAAIERVVEMGEAEHSTMRQHAKEYAASVARDERVVEQNRKLFQTATQKRSGRGAGSPVRARHAPELAGTTKARNIL